MSIETPATPTSTEADLRALAVKQLKKKRDFYGHALVYVLVNAFLVVIWAVTSNADSFFWPVFPMVGWGIGVVMNAWDVWFGEDFREDRIAQEMDRIRTKR